MATTAKRSDPKLWEKVKIDITADDRGGEAGQWSARKAQLSVQEYKRRGGGYAGAKQADNSLTKWTKEDWGTKSGCESLKSGERYLPRKARESLTKKEYDATTDKKRADLKAGKQFSRQPAAIAAKTASSRTDNKKRSKKSGNAP